MNPLPPEKTGVERADPSVEAEDAGHRSARQALLFGGRRTRRVGWVALGIAAGVVLLVGVAVLVLDPAWSELGAAWDRSIAWIETLNPVAVIPLMALLPIAGFPISVVYLVAGARFGPLLGGLVVAGVTTVHMVGTHIVGRSFLRAPLQRLIERRHRRLPVVPPDEGAAVAVIATLVPGPPYFVRNYLLVLAGVQLKTLLLVCVPIYVARSYVTILLGNLSGDPSARGLLVLLGIDGLKLLICAVVIWRLREHHRKFHPSGQVEPRLDGTAAPVERGRGKRAAR